VLFSNMQIRLQQKIVYVHAYEWISIETARRSGGIITYLVPAEKEVLCTPWAAPGYPRSKIDIPGIFGISIRILFGRIFYLSNIFRISRSYLTALEICHMIFLKSEISERHFHQSTSDIPRISPSQKYPKDIFHQRTENVPGISLTF
jgi:hypothetical protein